MKSDSALKTPDPNRMGRVCRPDLSVEQPSGALNKTVTTGSGTASRRRSMLGVGTKKMP